MRNKHTLFFITHVSIIVLFFAVVMYQILIPYNQVEATQTTVTLTASVDGKINQNAATTNFGSDQTMEIQRQSGSNTRRVLVKFDLSSIPSGATIDSATLTMYQSGGGSGLAGVQQDLHRVTRDWTENQMTWNKADSGTNWTTAGGDYNATATATLSPSSGGGNGTTRAFTVTSDVAAFVAGTQSNYGWIIKFNNESAASLTQTFHSSEGLTSQYWPSLSVTYTVNNTPRVAILSLSQRRDGSDIVDASVEAYDADADKLKMRIYNAVGCPGDSGQLTLGSTVTAGTNDSGGAPDVNASNYYQVGSTATTQIVSTASNTLQMTWLAGTDVPDAESSVCFGAGVNDGTLSGTSTLSFTYDTKDPNDPGNLSNPTSATTSVTFGGWGSACNSTDTNFKEYKLHYGTTAGLTTSDSAWTSSTYSGLGSSNCGSVGGVTEFWGLLTGTTYYARLFTYDLYGHYASSSSEVSFTTLVHTPGAPTVTASSTSETSLVVVVNTNGNSDSIRYDICKTDGGISCAAGGYVQADGSLGASSVKRTYAEWGGATGVSVTGLTANTAYAFSVRGYRSDGLGGTTDSNASNSVYTLANQVTSYNNISNATVTSTLGISLSWTNNNQTGLKIERDSGCDSTYDATVYDNASQNETSPTTTFANLSSATCYRFRYSSYNGDGVINTNSRPETGSITMPPAQPTSLAASSADTTSITWTWTSSGGSCFDLYYSSTGAIASYCAASSPTTISGLSPNTQYSVVVRARNDNGSSIASSAASTYTDANAPSSLSHTNQSTDSMRWTWVSGGSQSAYYAYDNSNVSNNSGWITDTFWDQSSMSANTAYTFAVKARNELGEETGVTTITRYTSQNTPSDVTFSNVTASSITATAGGSFPNIGSGSSVLVFSNGACATQNVNSGASWANSDLSPNTQYTYTVYATNGDGDQTSSASAATYTLAAEAGAPSAAPASATSLTLTLDRNSNPVGTNARLYETTTGQYVDTSARTLTGTSDSFASFTSWSSPTISGLSPNTGYRFLATTQNTNSIIAASSSASPIIYTYANVPASVSVSATGATQATLSWGANGNTVETQYYAENVTAGTNSGWVAAQSWASTGLTCGTTYTLRVKARNADEVETETQSTTASTSNCEAAPGVSSAPAQPSAQQTTTTTEKIQFTVTTPLDSAIVKTLPFDVEGTTVAGYTVTVEIASSTYQVIAGQGGAFKITILDQLVPGTYDIVVRVVGTTSAQTAEQKLSIVYGDVAEKTSLVQETKKEEQTISHDTKISADENKESSVSQDGALTSAPQGGTLQTPASRPAAASPSSRALITPAPTVATVNTKVKEAVIGKEAFVLIRQPSSAVFDQSQVGPLVLAGEKNIDLIVRPKIEVKSVVVRLYKKDGTQIILPVKPKQSSFLDWFLNAFVQKAFAKTVASEEPVASFVVPYDASLNVYRSLLDFPDLPKGEYTFVMTFNAQDGTQLTFSKAVVSLGKGYVYRPNGSPAARARLTLYRQDITGEYRVWASELFGQQNPVIVGDDGGYAAYIPEGNYYFTVESPGTTTYHSGIFVFKASGVIFDDVYLEAKQQDVFSRITDWFAKILSLLIRGIIGPWS